jgi:hypothetical protein
MICPFCIRSCQLENSYVYQKWRRFKNRTNSFQPSTPGILRLIPKSGFTFFSFLSFILSLSFPHALNGHQPNQTKRSSIHYLSIPMYHSDRSPQRSSSHHAHVVAPLTIDQLTEFVSTMIYLLWHARRSSVMALHSFSIQHNDTIPCLSVNQGDAACMLKGSSSAFRRFCQQVRQELTCTVDIYMIVLLDRSLQLLSCPNR